MPPPSASDQVLTAKRSAGLGRRALLGLIDQGLSSVTNFALNILVVSSVSSADYGAFALAYATYFLARSVVIALVGQPLLIRHTDEERVDGRTPLSYRRALGASLLLGLGGALLLGGAGVSWALLAGSPLIGRALVVLGFALPGLFLHDGLRSVYFASGRPQSAIAIDLAWGVAQLVTVAVLLATGHTQVELLLLAWGAAATVAAVAGLVVSRLLPKFEGALAWLYGARSLSLPILGEALIPQLALQGVTMVVAVLAGLEAVGVLRSALILASPLNVFLLAIPFIAVPEAMRILHDEPARHRRAMVMLSGALATMFGVWCAAIMLLPDGIGTRVLGASWPAASELLPEVLGYYVATALGVGAMVGLRTLELASRSFRARAAGSIVGLAAGAAGAWLAGAEGAALGLAAGAVVTTILLWVSFRAVPAQAGRAEAPASFEAPPALVTLPLSHVGNGRYRVGARVGRLPWADLHKGVDEQDRNRPVRISVHTHSGLDGSALPAVVDRLARAASRLDDPAVAPIVAWGLEGDVVYVVERWPEGPTLADVLATNPRSVALGAAVLEDLISALYAAHREGVVHGGLTPTDVVFSERGRGQAVLGGFVLPHACALATDHRHPEIGGDPHSAPERRGGTRPSLATDLYAVGAMVYEAVTGDPPGPCNGAGPAIPACLEDVTTPVAGLLAPDPQARSAAANAILQRLRADRGTEAVAQFPTGPEPWILVAAGPVRRRRRLPCGDAGTARSSPPPS